MDDTVLSSRIRLARNLKGHPFVLSDERAALLVKTVSQKLKKLDKFSLYRMDIFGESEAHAMIERHLVSPALVKNKRFGAAVISSDEAVSVMLNEEDHIREQCILSGLSLTKAYERLILIDRVLAGEFDFAYDSQLGYLTGCLTNLGTGMRASVMMFLPALTLTKTLEQCVAGVTRLNMAIRGVYGEGSESSGYVYQISNQRTLGLSEAEILQSVEGAAKHIAGAEIRAREYLLRTNHTDIKDKILRSFGLLSSCYKISHSEFTSLMAFIKLGVFYGFFSASDPAALSELVTELGPANITLSSGDLSAADRDILRAEVCRKRIPQLVKKTQN